MAQLRNFVYWKTLVFLLLASPAFAQGREAVPTVSGYMEMHLNKVEHLPAEADLHRFVLMVGHSFSDRIKFWSEVEVEHAFVEGEEESGEVAVEQAYIDLAVNRRVNVRAGMVLIPVGILNERHEPPTFHGVERTFVDTVIVPTTWRDVGAGVFGDLGRGFSFKAYVVPGLDAMGFSADEGIAEGRQQGGHANASDPAMTGRLEFRSRGLTAGGSFWYGGSGFGLVRLDIDPPTVGVGSVDARYRRGRHEFRGQWSMVSITGAGDLNRAIQARVGIGPNIASRLLGAYGEAATRISPDSWPHEVMVFGRYEIFDTQNKMPDGFLPLQHLKRSAFTTGVTYYPDPDVAFKMDFIQERNKSSVINAPWRMNLGVGWWF
ncbi:MAG TPA: hypothetical protein VM096_04450 [Vicinamibacterales bacterium]|nr:hypothetical protein [Vicinamibacterales bacterium]